MNLKQNVNSLRTDQGLPY